MRKLFGSKPSKFPHSFKKKKALYIMRLYIERIYERYNNRFVLKFMSVIKKIYQTSPYYGKVMEGDNLISVNGKKIQDLLDYMFFLPDEDEKVKIEVERNGEILSFEEIVTERDLRFDFENYLMDDQRSCKNKCMFCFIDQLPKNMRNTLYYKDDDYRLSLLYGNYVTMTNVCEEEIQRICDMKISPLNISVHTTNPELRVHMMKNPNAKNIMELLTRFKKAGINIRCQIVLCPEVNDGVELDRTLEDLLDLYPQVSSVSIVPVGLTKYREGLAHLKPFTQKSAEHAVLQINSWGEKSLEKNGTRLFYVADEFYQKACIPLPSYEYYEEFEQIENGVGMVISFAQEFMDACKGLRRNKNKFDVSLVTGVAGFPVMNRCINLLKTKYVNMDCKIQVIENEFFGKNITVTGLITGLDIINQLKEKSLGEFLIIPCVMLRDKTFLDDITLRDIEKELNIKVKVSGNNAEDLIDTIRKCR